MTSPADVKRYYFTRIALRGGLISPRFANRDRSPDKTRRAIQVWLNHSSKFYENQTVDRPFEVVLSYSDMYEEIIREHEWPDYVTLTNLESYQWCSMNLPTGVPTLLSRVDADDSYSIDFNEKLDTLVDMHKPRVHLWGKMYQWHIGHKKFTRAMQHPSPMFATVWNPCLPTLQYAWDHSDHDVKHPLFGIVGNHGHYAKSPAQKHRDLAYALMRITGMNAVNRMGLMGMRMQKWEWGPDDPRFIP